MVLAAPERKRELGRQRGAGLERKRPTANTEGRVCPNPI